MIMTHSTNEIHSPLFFFPYYNTELLESLSGNNK